MGSGTAVPLTSACFPRRVGPSGACSLLVRPLGGRKNDICRIQVVQMFVKKLRLVLRVFARPRLIQTRLILIRVLVRPPWFGMFETLPESSLKLRVFL